MIQSSFLVMEGHSNQAEIEQKVKYRQKNKRNKKMGMQTYSILTTKPNTNQNVTVKNFYETFIKGNVVQSMVKFIRRAKINISAILTKYN